MNHRSKQAFAKWITISQNCVNIKIFFETFLIIYKAVL